jgi:hypothetical protein
MTHYLVIILSIIILLSLYWLWYHTQIIKENFRNPNQNPNPTIIIDLQNTSTPAQTSLSYPYPYAWRSYLGRSSISHYSPSSSSSS